MEELKEGLAQAARRKLNAALFTVHNLWSHGLEIKENVNLHSTPEENFLVEWLRVHKNAEAVPSGIVGIISDGKGKPEGYIVTHAKVGDAHIASVLDGRHNHRGFAAVYFIPLDIQKINVKFLTNGELYAKQLGVKSVKVGVLPIEGRLHAAIAVMDDADNILDNIERYAKELKRLLHTRAQKS